MITFPGFLLAYESGRDEPADEDEGRRLPHLEVGQQLEATTLEPEGHETSPPPRYTEASLVKALEERGIGRRRYASILGTIVDRGYVFKKGTARCRASSPSRSRSCSRPLRAARRLRLHGPHGGRPRPDRGRRRGAVEGCAASTSATAHPACTRRHGAPRRDRRARRQLDRDRERDRDRAPRRPLRPLLERDGSAPASPRTSRPTS